MCIKEVTCAYILHKCLYNKNIINNKKPNLLKKSN